MHTGASAARVQTAPGHRSRKTRTPVPAGRKHTARCNWRIPFARLVYPPTARIAPPPTPTVRLLSPLSPPPLSFLIPRACATLGNGRCVAVPEGWAGRGSDAPMRLRPNDATGRAWRWAGRGSDAPMRADRAEGRAVMPIRRPDRRMKIEGWIYQYLPLSGIRPMPSRSKCLSSSSIHLSRLSL